MFGSIEDTVKSLNDYVERKSLENVVITVEDNLYTMRIDGEIEFQTKWWDSIVAHIDVVTLHLRFS